MTKEEKAQYMQNKKEKELSDREAAVTRSELMAEAKNNLSDEGLPVELAEVLNYTDADACKKSMETVKKAFQTAVEKYFNVSMMKCRANECRCTLGYDEDVKASHNKYAI